MKAKEYIKYYGEGLSKVCLTNRSSDGLPTMKTGEHFWVDADNFISVFGEMDVSINGDFYKPNSEGLYDTFICDVR